MKHLKKEMPKMMKGGKMQKMPGGGMMQKMPGGGMMKKDKMPMYMYGGKVFAEGGKMLDGILDDPAQAKRAAAHPNVKKQMGAK